MFEDRDGQGFDELMRHLPFGEAVKADIASRMSEGGRHYHGVDHLALLWRRHRAFGAPAYLDPERTDALIACAIAFHDCVYDGTRTDNEERSARHWLASSRAGALPEPDRQWVADAIRATSDHLSFLSPMSEGAAPPETAQAVQLRRARQWFLDLDLTPLGEQPAAFDRNTALLRREFSHLDDATWDEARLSYLRRFRDAPRIYGSPALAAAFEEPARRNIRRQFPSP